MLPTSTLIIRNASSNDFSQIAELIGSCLKEFGRNLSLEADDKDLVDIESTYMDSNGIFLVAEHEKKVVGTVAVLRLTSDEGMLKKMYLQQAYRGKGIGKRLLEEAINRSRQLHIHKLYLETLDEMLQAISLYKQYGFTTVRRITNSIRCDLLMSLDISAT